DKGSEVKLSPSEHYRWFEARRDRDLAAGHRRPSASKPEAEKAQAAAKSETSKETTQGKKEPAKEKAQSKVRTRRTTGPFVDKQRDKALEVLRAQLDQKPKAA